MVDNWNIAKLTEFTNLIFAQVWAKENMKDKADILPADKHQSFPQIDTIILNMCDQACPNYPK